jgi:hypothetical protein
LSLNNQNFLSADERWVYLWHNQARIVNRPHPLEAVLTEGSIGYTLNAAQRVYLGYYWADFSPYHKDAQENRLFHEFYWRLESNEQRRIATRTRLEVNWYTGTKQNLVMWRQLFAKEDLKFYFGRLNPLVYDEVFFRLNNPDYATPSFLSQNWLFLGCNYYLSRQSFWKIGYLNQFLMKTAVRPYGMMHLLSVTYIFGVTRISLPIDN